MRLNLFTFIALILLCFISCNQSSDADTNTYLLTGLNIVDVESGEINKRQSILIENNIITDVFDDNSKNPDVETVQKFDDKYVIPGLWDMHVHLRGGIDIAASNRKMLPLYVAHGVTAVRDAGGDLTDSVLVWREKAANRILTGPSIYTSGPKLDGPDGTWEGSLEVETPEDVTAALDSLESIGVDYVKIYDSTLSNEAYLEIIRQAEERGFKTTGHMPMSAMIDEAIDAGLDGIDHLYYVMKGTSDRESEIVQSVREGKLGFWAAVKELMESYNEEKALAFYKKLAANNVVIVPTLHIDDVLSYLHENDHSNDEFLTYIPEDIQQTYNRRLNSAKRRTSENIEFEEQLNQHFKNITKDLQKAGVTILAGSDTGAYNSFVYPGISIHKELQAMVAAGLTPAEALKTATINGAKFFNAYDESGSIEPGKKADLLILNANPLKDISNTTSTYAVINKGDFLSKIELNQLFRKK